LSSPNSSCNVKCKLVDTNNIGHSCPSIYSNIYMYSIPAHSCTLPIINILEIKYIHALSMKDVLTGFPRRK
jgi:hypothetical protein